MFNGTLVERKIRSREYLELQGWPDDAADAVMAFVNDDRGIRAAAGNGFSYNVVEKLMQEFVNLLLSDQ